MQCISLDLPRRAVPRPIPPARNPQATGCPTLWVVREICSNLAVVEALYVYHFTFLNLGIDVYPII